MLHFYIFKDFLTKAMDKLSEIRNTIMHEMIIIQRTNEESN